MVESSEYPGLTVEVHVEGESLREYECENVVLKAGTIIRYIEATTAARFEIVVHIPGERFPKDVSITARIDGAQRSSICSRASGQDRTEIISKAWRKADSQWFHSDISFSEIMMIQSEDDTEVTEPSTDIGVIEVELSHARDFYQYYRKRGAASAQPNQQQYDGVMSEQALGEKARSHYTRLNNTRQMKGAIRHRWKKDDSPFMAFQFRYRSLDILRSLGIVDRSSESQGLLALPQTAGTGKLDDPTSNKSNKPLLIAQELMASIHNPISSFIEDTLSVDPSTATVAERMHLEDQHVAQIEPVSSHIHKPGTEHETINPPCALNDVARTLEQHMVAMEPEPPQHFENHVQENPPASTFHESVTARDSRHLSIVTEDEDHDPAKELRGSSSATAAREADVKIVSVRTASSSTDQRETYGLTSREIIVMLANYRGREDGLVGRSRRALLSLLKFYEEQDEDVSSVKHEPAADNNSGIRVKREPDVTESAMGVRKRSKPEVIVLDE